MKSLSRYFFIAFLFVSIFASISSFSQAPSQNDTSNYPYWASMMQDPNANFHATQSAFEKYWANRTIHKGNGWKVFKRWEYIQHDRVQPDGKLRPPDYVKNEYLKSLNTPKSVSGSWSQVGPVALPGNSTGQPNGLGRINAIGFHPTDANIFYIGSPSGGFWKTSTGGTSWTLLSAAMPTLGVSAILVHPTTPNTIWIGTGDRDAGDAPGMGVYKSTDGGTTWNVSNTGMGNLTVGMLIIHPSDHNIILATTSGGIYKSVNGGSTWVLKSSNSSHYKDIKFKPGDPTIVYATENGRFYRSTNTGDSWTQITIPVTGSRLVIGVTQANSAYVYLMQTNGVFAGILRSANSGLTFTTYATSPNIMDYACDGSGSNTQAWYDLCIAVDPVNAETIYLGGVNIWKSTNGGATLTINSHWVGSSWGEACAPSVHADIHTLNFSPDGTLYTGCDGGIYRTSNGGTTWSDISSGLAIAQIYKIGQSATSSGLTISGYQDNGTASCSGSAFTTVIGGDGMECLVDYSNSTYRYGSIYYGEICRSTGGWYYTIGANGSNGITEDGGWVTPYILHRTDPNTMFAGYINVWRSNNVKTSSSSSVTWTMISSSETSNCIVLEQSPVNLDLLYVVRSGQMKRTENANAATPTWVSCTLPGGYTPTDLEVHPTLANVIYATAQYKVYKSTDKGATWANISANLPSVYINCLVYDKNSNEGLYVGNETSIYYKDATMTNWVRFNTGLPVVDVRELEIYYDANSTNNRIKAATYGRGLWQSDLVGSTPTLAVTPSNQSVTAAAGSTTFTVTTTSDWTATSNQAWCTVTTSGTGTGPITATYSQNSTGSSRVATITVTVTGLSPVSVTVTQAAPTLSVTPSNQNVSATAGTTPFSVTSNSNWTAASNQTWCTVTASGTGDGTITATYTANTIVTSRVANITVTVSGLTPVVVTVTQAGATPILTVTPSNQNVTPSPGNTSFTVTSNTTWSANSNQAWCSVTPSGSGNGTMTATYLVNNTTSLRTANLTVTVTGLSPVVVTVTQAAPTLSVTPADRPVSNTAGSTTFSVTSNTSWNTSSDQTWCTINSSGTGNGTITANYTENLTYVQRIATITITVSGLTPVVVTVTQDAAPAPEFYYTIANDVQTSDRTLEFDLFLLDTQPSVPLELSIIQAGVMINSGIINGGTITPSLVSGFSDLVTLQQPTSINWATGSLNGCIKITPRAGPGCGSGTIIASTGNGTRICRVQVTNSVPFTPSSQANLAFSFTTSPYPTKVFQYSGTPCSSNQMTTNANNCFSLANNPVLNGPPALAVSPSDQAVTSQPGTIPFVVTSNAAWTVTSNQTWLTVTPSGFGNGTISASYSENTGPAPRVAGITVTVTGLAPVVVTVTQEAVQTRTLNLSLFLEGLYAGSSSMHAAMDESSYHWGETIADKLTIELHDGANYPNIVYTAANVTLNTNGTASFALPSSFNGNYYVTLRQRNHILTSSALPLSFNTSVINYSFDAPNKAYGNNMLLMIDGKWVFYAGDVNQDDVVDGSDLSLIGNKADYAISGYLNEDVNGDGLIDGSDLSITSNSADFAIGAITP